MPIHVLAPSVASKIAAGEVIERPASVVKELIENALDAGAREISVEVLGGGTRLIRVRDDGAGIAPTEVALAFERHATSKLSDADDLLQVQTLGFRGEALPSIAAVADVTLLTRRAEDLAGAFVHLRGGKLLEQSRRGAPTGTVVTVRDLFGRFPARRKFLRSPATEASHCAAVMNQYALARPDVRFSLALDGNRSLQTPGNGDLRDAAAAVLGRGMAEGLLELDDQDRGQGAQPLITIRGLVSPPGMTRANRGHLSIFVNGRWVQNRALSFAVEQAYSGSVMTGRHPIAVLHVNLPPPEVDVNVHPRKLEVRFRNEGEVFAAVQRSVRGALVEAGAVSLAAPAVAPAPGFNGGSRAVGPGQAAAALELFSAPRDTQGTIDPLIAPRTRQMPVLRVVGQVGGTYVVAEGPDGMYLVDQHAAHERVLFERAQARLAQQGLDTQGLLTPQILEMPADDLALVLGARETLEQYGFQMEGFGERSVLVRGLPAGMREQDTQEVLAELARGLRSGEDQRDRLAASIACHSAVRAGDALTPEEMRRLIQELEECRGPQTCPHGRPTMMHLSAALLERQFGRRG